MVQARFEHVALNVSDMESTADWYCDHLAMVRVRHNPGRKLFLADHSGVVVLELYSNGEQPRIDLAATTAAEMHIAFVVDDIHAAVDELVTAGATVESAPSPNMDDTLAMLRDPFGLALQLVQRQVALLT